ncbi:MAG: histidine phosphatase family protein [Planctomycetota bacterium]|jgi:broad specificity phosphatase PhoE|nr:histidine phosphatase family protein [Planctomycetota bacterium]
MKLLRPPDPPEDRPDADPTPPRPAAVVGASLWLVRHAQVDEAFHSIAYGSEDVALSAEGLANTDAMAEAFGGLPIAAVLSSDLERALAMGRGVARATGAPLRSTPGLREIDRGRWQGIERSRFHERWLASAEAYWKDPFRWRSPGGESDEDLLARVWPELERGLADAGGGPLVVCAHANVIRVALAHALGYSTPDSYRFATFPAHANLLVGTADGWHLEAANAERPRPVAD